MIRNIQCAQCGCAVVARAPNQRYCPACSEARDLQRKRLWAASHPPSKAQLKRDQQHAQRRKESARDAGRLANRAAARSGHWFDPAGPDLIWLVRFAVPFSYAASKNHIYTLRSRGHVALRRESRAIRSMISQRIRSAVADRKVAHNKLWIDLLVQKPDHRGDAVNVVDLVCDGLKDGLDLDDRWFCIRRLDWEIVKNDGRLYIGVGQESEVDCRVCSYCGQAKPLGEFNKSKHSPLGVGRECRECRRAGRLLAKAQRTQQANDTAASPEKK